MLKLLCITHLANIIIQTQTDDTIFYNYTYPLSLITLTVQYSVQRTYQTLPYNHTQTEQDLERQREGKSVIYSNT